MESDESISDITFGDQEVEALSDDEIVNDRQTHFDFTEHMVTIRMSEEDYKTVMQALNVARVRFSIPWSCAPEDAKELVVNAFQIMERRKKRVFGQPWQRRTHE